MRFLVQVRADESTEAGKLPSEELLAAMMEYNEELAEAGVLVTGEGLKPSSEGARVTFRGSERIVTDGPFPEARELIAGFWIFEVDSLEEAIVWVKRCPNPLEGESVIEIRPFYEADDFGEEFTPELREREERIRRRTEAR